LQNQFNAEFGHSTGGQFNTVLKGGGNDIHGSGFWYLQNRKLNALDVADIRQGMTAETKPRFDQNRLGGSVGGPIKKNKLFYYGLFEYSPLGQASSPSSPILAPTSAGMQMLDQIGGLSQTNLGVFKQFVDAAPQQLVDTAGPRTTSVGGVDIPLGILPISFPNFSNEYTWLASVDYNISDSDQLRFRYIQSQTDAIDIDVSPDLPVFSDTRKTRNQLFSLSEFHSFSPNLFNELRLSYSKFLDAIPVPNFDYPGLDVFPNITIEQDLNLQLGPFDNGPQSGSQNIYQLVNNTTYVRGAHSFKFGIDARRFIAPTTFIQRLRGDYNYGTLERYLQDLQPDLQAQRNIGGRPYWGNSWNFYWFAQDEWKIKPNMTLTLGIRHEYKGIPADDKLQALNAVSNVPGVLEFNEPTAQKTNFAPRVGLTYSPGTSGKTVFRAGFGMSYDNYFDNLGTLSKPPQLEQTFLLPSGDTPNFLANGGIQAGAQGDDLTAEEWRASTGTFIFNQRLPIAYQWSFGIERVIADDYTVNVRYLGTRGSRLFTQSIINLKPTITPDRHLPTFLSRPSE
ncbi:MAG: TonB-dependent receptor, partial [bacterium]|nr:TonB-dependent receptor [bacterium]